MGRDLFGEVTEARFRSFATALRAIPVVIDGPAITENAPDV
jgi:exopolyphosphatase/guanosine-5'-triphosphate,3'-diphosphate pyrophosphatase